MLNLLTATFQDVSEAVQTKKISAVEVTKFFLTRAEKLNPSLNAFTHMNSEALGEAEKVDLVVASGKNAGPRHR